MGVDISGKNPIVRGIRPSIDWDTATDSEQEQYWTNRAKWHAENPGDYYQDNWWGWRPIVELIEIVNIEKDLGLDTSCYGSNDGAGPDDQETCDRLADALAEKLTELILKNPELTDDSDEIYLMLGSWVNEDGSFIDKKVSDKLTEDFDYGQLMLTGVVTKNGLAFSAHATTLGRIKRFIAFLRECGGFEIW
jgi:hypothetical protein